MVRGELLQQKGYRKNQNKLIKFFLIVTFFFSFISSSNLSYSVQTQQQYNQTECVNTDITKFRKRYIGYYQKANLQSYSTPYHLYKTYFLLVFNRQMLAYFNKLIQENKKLIFLKTQLFYKIIKPTLSHEFAI